MSGDTLTKEKIAAMVADRIAEAGFETGTAEEEQGNPESTGMGPFLSPAPQPPKVFPSEVQMLLNEAGEAFSVPPSIPVAVFLALLSCLVGRTRAISPKRGWKEHGNIWMVVVAPSGLGKTPVSHAFFRPVAEQEYRKFQEWKQECERYSAEMMDFNRTKKEERGYPPKPPKRTQYYLDDATLEALGDALMDNPRGVMWRVDELSGLLSSFDKYSSGGKEGGTRARLLSSYDCQEWKSSRRDASRNVHIPAACVSIFGGLQPAMVERSFDGSDADVGFLPRFMFIRAEREKPALWTEDVLSAGSEILLRRIVDGLLAFDLMTLENGEKVPAVISLSPDAKRIYIDWYDQQAVDGWMGLSDGKAEAWAQKLKGHALRLCLLLHCLDAAIQGGDGLSPVAADTMEKALRLAEWVKENQVQTLSLFEGAKPSVSPVERAIMEAVVEEVERCGGDSLTIPNARLVELVNGKLPCPVDSRVIGKAASSLGMGSCLSGEKRLRARTVHSETLEMFRTHVSNVSNVSPR